MNRDMDEIGNPSHYTEGREYEPKDVIGDWGLNFNLGNVVKYVSRAGRKGDAVEDLRKARQYLDFEIDARTKADTARRHSGGDRVGVPGRGHRCCPFCGCPTLEVTSNRGSFGRYGRIACARCGAKGPTGVMKHTADPDVKGSTEHVYRTWDTRSRSSCLRTLDPYGCVPTCPFCGEERDKTRLVREHDGWTLQCDRCCAHGPVDRDAREAKGRWCIRYKDVARRTLTEGEQ